MKKTIFDSIVFIIMYLNYIILMIATVFKYIENMLFEDVSYGGYILQIAITLVLTIFSLEIYKDEKDRNGI